MVVIYKDEATRIAEYVNAFDDKATLFKGYPIKHTRVQYEQPIERLHDMFIKRLDGSRLWLNVTNIPHLGHIIVEHSILFNIADVIAADYITDIGFSAESGASGVIRVDWLRMTVHVKINAGEAYDVDFKPDMYVVHNIAITDVEYISKGCHEINAILDMSAATDDDIVSAWIGRDLSSNAASIRRGVLEQATFGKGLFPGRKVTLKDVAIVTGVTPSTLSNLRNYKKPIANLSHTTMVLLTYFGRIIDLERQLYYSEVSAGVSRETAPEASSVPDVIIRMTDGIEYEAINYTDLSTDEFYEMICDMVDEPEPMLKLNNVTIDGKTASFMSHLSIPKRNIDGVFVLEEVLLPGEVIE